MSSKKSVSGILFLSALSLAVLKIHAADAPVINTVSASPNKTIAVDSASMPKRIEPAKVIVSVDSNKNVTTAAKPDTTKILSDNGPAKPDSLMHSSGNTIAKNDSLIKVDSVAAATPKKRARIVRETTVNTIDELKGKYRSPKKALFMSLVIPGLGQAYVGSYARGIAYAAIDVGLMIGWHHYVVTKYDRQVSRYQVFADSNWRQSRYETEITQNPKTAGKTPAEFKKMSEHRESYCDAIQIGSSSDLKKACTDLNMQSFKEYNDANISTDSVSQLRSNFKDTRGFYELIGKDQEFFAGWSDVKNIVYTDSSISGSSDLRDTYVSMRKTATDYSRLQAYFLGGIVINHIVSAIDAGLSAHYHNKALYQTEVRWYDKIRLQSYLAWEGNLPTPTVNATLTF